MNFGNTSTGKTIPHNKNIGCSNEFITKRVFLDKVNNPAINNAMATKDNVIRTKAVISKSGESIVNGFLKAIKTNTLLIIILTSPQKVLPIIFPMIIVLNPAGATKILSKVPINRSLLISLADEKHMELQNETMPLPNKT